MFIVANNGSRFLNVFVFENAVGVWYFAERGCGVRVSVECIKAEHAISMLPLREYFLVRERGSFVGWVFCESFFNGVLVVARAAKKQAASVFVEG